MTAPPRGSASVRLAAWLTHHPRIQALLDHPGLFHSFRFALVGRQTATRRLLRLHLEPRAGQRLLDLCCGIGEFAPEFDCRYVGIDLNYRFVRAAARTHAQRPRKAFLVMDALKLAFRNKEFDKAMSVNSFHHFSDEDVRRVLTELKRVTRDRVIIIDADGTPKGWLRRMLVAADRGAWMRSPSRLETIIGSVLTIHAVVPFRVGLYTEILYECSTT
jgi:ubiquinone/menaquinone biosynthesis C-methylase UbiE